MRLIEYLPGEYHESPEIAAIQAALQPQIDALRARHDDFIAQLNVQTATWGLEYWERALGIEVDVAKPLPYRRERICAKLRTQGTTTAELIRDVAASFSGGEVEVIEYPEEHRFVVKFTGTIGTPPNMDDLTAAIEEVKPAHLAFEYAFRYLLIRDVHGMSLRQLNETMLHHFAGGMANG